MPSLEESSEGSEKYDASRMAALLGVHLVGQVLDEACTIVGTAQRIGWFKDIKSGRLTVSGHADLFEILQGDNETLNEDKDNVSHITTSTPHKDEIIKSKHDNSFIGQGDEEIDIVGKEGVNHHDEEEIKSDTEGLVIENEAQVFSSYIMVAIMEKLYETAFDLVPANEDVEAGTKDIPKTPKDLMEKLCVFRTTSSEPKIIEIKEGDDKVNNAEEYCCSLLENAYEGDPVNDIAFYIDEEEPSVDNNFNQIKVVVQAEIHTGFEENIDASVDEISDEEAERSERLEAARYENAYLSLNRDYELCSEDEGDPILQDPKSPMQDVELITASTEDEDDDSSLCREEVERKELAATSAISGASGSRKSRTSLVSRCRSQGARLLSCLRGWWRRKTPGKRKESRATGSIHGVCPLSPDARRRAASLLDQRHLYSPVPSRSVVWKFNTVNEAVVNSSKWKEYTFEVNPEACGEHC